MILSLRFLNIPLKTHDVTCYIQAVQGQTINSVTSQALPSLTVPSSVSKTFPARGEKKIKIYKLPKNTLQVKSQFTRQTHDEPHQ